MTDAARLHVRDQTTNQDVPVRGSDFAAHVKVLNALSQLGTYISETTLQLDNTSQGLIAAGSIPANANRVLIQIIPGASASVDEHAAIRFDGAAVTVNDFLITNVLKFGLSGIVFSGSLGDVRLIAVGSNQDSKAKIIYTT